MTRGNQRMNPFCSSILYVVWYGWMEWENGSEIYWNVTFCHTDEWSICAKELHKAKQIPHTSEWQNKTILFLFSHTDKILLEASVTTGFGLESVYFGEVFFEWKYQIIDIFSDEYFEHEISSLFEKNLRNVENSKIELYWSILIYTCHSSGGWSNIWSNQIELSDLETIEIGSDFFIFKNTLFEKMNVGMTKIWINFLNIYTHSFVTWLDNLCDYLKKTSWCCCNIENIHLWFDDLIFFLDFDEFERTSCSKSEFFCFFKIRVVDNKWFGHIGWQIRKSRYTIVI